MSTITILGAGAMGSALCTPLADAGHQVRLWGTHLDDHLIAAVRAGQPHPRTQAPLAAGVASFTHTELDQALTGADVVVLAVASVGVADITALAAPRLAGVKTLWLTSKGFAPDAQGRIELLPQTMERVLAEHQLDLPIVAIGGPCKANEVAERQPTAPIFAGAHAAAQAAAARTQTYRPAHTEDRDGVELCAALKNVFAIALGVADGLTQTHRVPFHDLKSAIFAQGLAELRIVLEHEGADPWTALGLAGAGDLEVTGLSGRNKVYGSRLGAGQNAQQALAEMTALEQTVEGVPAVALVEQFIAQRMPGLAPQLPLLAAINQVVHHGAGIQALIEASLPS